MCLPLAAAGAPAVAATATTAAGVSSATMAALYASSLALTTIGAGAGLIGQRNAAKAQNAYVAATAEQANEAFIDQSKTISRRTIEERDADSVALTQNAIEGARARGRAKASAAEAGTAGLSVDALMADYSRQQAGYSNAILINQKNRELAAQDELRGAGARAQSRITAVSTPIQRPDYFGSALRIGSAGLGTYADYKASQR